VVRIMEQFHDAVQSYTSVMGSTRNAARPAAGRRHRIISRQRDATSGDT